jgi:hypothetical protein
LAVIAARSSGPVRLVTVNRSSRIIVVHLRALSALRVNTRTSMSGFVEMMPARTWAALPVPQMSTRTEWLMG